MACESATTYLLTGLLPAGLFNFNGRQIGLFYIWNSLWIDERGLGWCPCEIPEVGPLIYRLSCKFNDNLRASK